jgi:hypothetical protein
VAPYVCVGGLRYAVYERSVIVNKFLDLLCLSVFGMAHFLWSGSAFGAPPPTVEDVLELAAEAEAVTHVLEVAEGGRMVVVFSSAEVSVPMLKIRVFACGGRCFFLAEINRVPLDITTSAASFPFDSKVVDNSVVEIRRVSGEVILQARFN